MNKVAVIGPGALGCLFAARLARCGISVWLIDYQKQRAAILQKTGITLEGVSGNFTQKITAATEIPRDLDLILVLTKAYSTPNLHFPANTPILTLQNGLGNADVLASSCGEERILAGTTSEAVTWLNIGHVRHVAIGRTVFGAWTECDTTVAHRVLQEAGFAVTITDDPKREIWKKAIINAGINPLTAILNIPNGSLLDKHETRELMCNLVIEATQAAKKEGHHFECSLTEETENICKITRDNISSMLQDIRRGKPTEIDAISGEILRRSQNAALPAPNTKVIYQLLRALEIL